MAQAEKVADILFFFCSCKGQNEAVNGITFTELGNSVLGILQAWRVTVKQKNYVFVFIRKLLDGRLGN